ncbi:MAG: hypothetical protein KatS3mg072_1400 [Meiothermus sp.]|nr:MAG: hypothetical protein KatS3mg072_1400 [Meiothermus sp.]
MGMVKQKYVCWQEDNLWLGYLFPGYGKVADYTTTVIFFKV